jgi:hypothetical protein
MHDDRRRLHKISDGRDLGLWGVSPPSMNAARGGVGVSEQQHPPARACLLSAHGAVGSRNAKDAVPCCCSCCCCCCWDGLKRLGSAARDRLKVCMCSRDAVAWPSNIKAWWWLFQVSSCALSVHCLL